LEKRALQKIPKKINNRSIQANDEKIRVELYKKQFINEMVEKNKKLVHEKIKKHDNNEVSMKFRSKLGGIRCIILNFNLRIKRRNKFKPWVNS